MRVELGVGCCYDGMGPGVGIYDGQLFYLVKEVKTDSDTKGENELKSLLLTLILGQGVLQIVEHNGREYFCASQQAWEEALGIAIRAH